MKRGTPDHPKMLHLAALLKRPRYGAVGVLEMLWHFAARYAPRGDIGRFTDEQIASAVEWNGRPEQLIGALEVSHWIDRNETHRLVIHDWHQHADATCDTYLRDNDLTYWNDMSPRRKDTRRRVMTRADMSRHVGTPLPEPEPESEPEAEGHDTRTASELLEKINQARGTHPEVAALDDIRIAEALRMHPRADFQEAFAAFKADMAGVVGLRPSPQGALRRYLSRSEVSKKKKDGPAAEPGDCENAKKNRFKGIQ